MKFPLSRMVVLVGLLLGGPLCGQTIHRLEPSSEPVHIRVLFEQNPAREAVVSWTTTSEEGEHLIYLCTEPREGDLSAYSRQLPSIHTAPYTLRPDEEEAGMDAWSHNVYLGDLEPATRYYLTVSSNGEISREYYFKTAPEDNRPVALLFVGDSRVGNRRTDEDNNRRRVNALMARMIEKHPEVVAMAHGADYTNRAYWSQLYFWLKDHHEMTTGEDGRLLPIIPSRGNHDLDVGFEEMFWWPDRATPYYYTTNLNGQSVLITLNTEISRGGEQREWLIPELQTLRPEKRWVVAQYHRPAWPSVRDFSSGASQRRSWVPLFEDYGVDLIYECHDHSIKRTHPIYRDEINPERGIVYFGDGGGGVAQRRPDTSRWYLAMAGRHHHAHILLFTDDSLDLYAYNIADELIDEYHHTQDRRGFVPEPRAEGEDVVEVEVEESQSGPDDDY